MMQSLCSTNFLPCNGFDMKSAQMSLVEQCSNSNSVLSRLGGVTNHSLFHTQKTNFLKNPFFFLFWFIIVVGVLIGCCVVFFGVAIDADAIDCTPKLKFLAWQKIGDLSTNLCGFLVLQSTKIAALTNKFVSKHNQV